MYACADDVKLRYPTLTTILLENFSKSCLPRESVFHSSVSAFMDYSKLRKSQGRININAKAPEKLLALFSQESDTSLVSSVAERSTDKGEITVDHSISSTSITDSNFNTATCVGANSLPKIVITPSQSAYGNRTEKRGVVTSGAKENSTPTMKLPPLPISQLRPPERIFVAKDAS